MRILLEFECDDCSAELTIGIVREEHESPVPSEIRGVTCPRCRNSINPNVIQLTDLDNWQHTANTFLNANNFVGAIKHCRMETGVSLKEAKETVEAMPEYQKMRDRQDRIQDAKTKARHRSGGNP